MSVFEKAKHCTKRFPCRYKLALVTFTAAMLLIPAVVVPLAHI
jgi:hypothetical protein